ncbi:MAG TPA: helix-turn-helix domain-containing protein [Blastocatellia bacterium]|nr:helix-turn-helix domain-containing protein [Blastocatellia bacterium]
MGRAQRVKQRVRLSAADRRLQIVRTAMDLFARKGFDGTTTKEIAQASGVTEAIIFRHFATKEDLYSAIIDYKMKERRLQVQAALDEAASRRDDRAFFTRLAEAILDHYSEDPCFMRLMLYSALEGHRLSQMVYETHAAEMFQYLTRYITQRIKEGAFRPIHPRAAVRAFVGMAIHHALVRELFDPQQKHLKLSNRQAAAIFADIFLDGVFSSSESSGERPSGRRSLLERKAL